MRFERLGYAAMASVLISSLLLASFAAAYAKNDKVRVLSESDEKVSAAVTSGCDIVRETKVLKALTCSPEVASSLGLQEDIRVFAMYMGAN